MFKIRRMLWEKFWYSVQNKKGILLETFWYSVQNMKGVLLRYVREVLIYSVRNKKGMLFPVFLKSSVAQCVKLFVSSWPSFIMTAWVTKQFLANISTLLWHSMSADMKPQSTCRMSEVTVSCRFWVPKTLKELAGVLEEDESNLSSNHLSLSSQE